MRAIRDNPQKAAYLTVEVQRTRLWSFVISASILLHRGRPDRRQRGAGGPGTRLLDAIGQSCLYDLLGGSGAFAGPVLGAWLFVFLQDALISSTVYWRFVLGAILVAIIVFVPKGLARPSPGSAAAKRLNVTGLLTVTKCFEKLRKFRALSDVSFPVGSDEFVAIIGPNGAGKTTLVNVVTGLLKPSSGRGPLHGSRHSRAPGRSNLSRRGMARTFQLVQIFPTLTVRETLSIAIASRRSSMCRTPCGGCLRTRPFAPNASFIACLFRLASRLETQAATLSQGERKLLDIASAFTLKPELILLDEPTSGVSTSEKHTLMQRALGSGPAGRHPLHHACRARHGTREPLFEADHSHAGRAGARRHAHAAFFTMDSSLVSRRRGKPPVIATGAAAHALDH